MPQVIKMSDDRDKIRLQLFLARAGAASRRKCADLIGQGLVKVNGEVVLEPFFKVDPEKDLVLLNDRKLTLIKYKFLRMYKPIGVLTTMRDERGRKTIADLIPPEYGKVFPVGRLDYDSEGLIILTNHGEAANRMMHPRYHFPKVYHVTLDQPPEKSHLLEMSRGIELDGVMTMPAAYELIGKPGSTLVRVTIEEGRKRQIRKVFKEFLYHVINLKRLAIGPIELGDMKPGEIEEFTLFEILELLDRLELGSI